MSENEEWKPPKAKYDWLEEYENLHKNLEDEMSKVMGIPSSFSGETTPINSDNINLLPVAMKISAKTIGLDLVQVKPLEMSTKPGKSKEQQLRQDRLNKIRKLEGKEPDVILPDDTTVSAIDLYYTDYTYSSGSTQNNI